MPSSITTFVAGGIERLGASSLIPGDAPAAAGAAATLFSAASTTALVTWAAVGLAVLVPPLRRRTWPVTGVVVPATLAVSYAGAVAVWLVRTRVGAPPPDATAVPGGFGSIAAVRTLFADDFALAGGWVHYLAFDLAVGTALARESLEAGVPRLVLLPCLGLTFLAGPAGLLAGLLALGVTRWRARRRPAVLPARVVRPAVLPARVVRPAVLPARVVRPAVA